MSKRKAINKTIACILICVMVFQLFPSIVLGITEIKEQEIQEEKLLLEEEFMGEKTVVAQEEKEAEIIGEDITKRTLNEKHFMLDNGAMLAAIYADHVHYEKDGKLEEINNTLKETENSKNEKVYENTANSFKVSFQKEANKNKLVTLKKGEFEINWALENVGADSISAQQEEVNTNEIETTEELELDEEVVEEIKKIEEETGISILEDLGADFVPAQQEEKIAVKNTSSRIEYNNIIKNIDLKYDVTATKVKESIIINNKEAIQDHFTFIFETGTLTAELTEENEIILYNQNKEEIIYKIETPYMFDTSEQYSYEIEVKLEETTKEGENNKQYRITITPNKEWLQDETRTYPITIDPTIETSQRREKIQDTFIYNGDINNWSRGNAHIIRIGNTNSQTLKRKPSKRINKI